MSWNVMLICVTIAFLAIQSVYGRTDRVRILSCDGNNRRIVAAQITSGDVRGILECYYEPMNGNYLFRIKIGSLDLEKLGDQCPEVKFIGFTSKMKLPDEDDDWEVPDREIMVPADPQMLAFFDCNNYKTAAGKIFETKTAGQKIQFIYDTKNIDRSTMGNVNFTITSYLSGPSYRCPEEHFRCWSTQYVCIAGSLECDGIDNCYDNSDEDNYKCTGMIMGMYLPMFIIMLLLIVIVLIGVIIAIVLACRRRNRKIAKAVEVREKAAERNAQMPYYLPHQQPQYTQPPPEISGDRSNWKRLEREHHAKANSVYQDSADC